MTTRDMLLRMSLVRLVALLFLSPAFLCIAQATSKLPLHTSNYQIVDAASHPIRLMSVNWYGFDDKNYVPAGLVHPPSTIIAERIMKMGFIALRLPWANETREKNPLVSDYA